MARVPNIAGRAAYGRLLLVPIGMAGAALVYWLQTALALPREVRLLAFLPLLVATYGFFQYREKTCVRLALQDRCDMGGGVEAIEDPALRYRIRQQAMVVHATAILSAAGITAVLYVI
jgi:hypothetical protein